MNAIHLAAAGGFFFACRAVAEDSAGTGKFLLDGWRPEQGLPDKAVTAILQDQSGYLWIGTTNGLARFDGIHFTTFNSLNTPELPDNHILGLYENRTGALWVETERGLTCFDHGHLSVFGEKDGLSSERILCAAEDAAGHLWAGTDAGLNRLEQGRFTSFFTLEGLPDDQINAIATVQNRLIFATGKGLAEFAGVKFRLFNPVSGLPADEIRELQRDGRGNLWLANAAGLWEIRLRESVPDLLHPYQGSVTAFTISRAQKIWLGTANGDLEELAGGNPGRPSAVIAHFPSAISAFCEDREHGLWVGTRGDGLYRLKQSEFSLTSPIGLKDQEVFSLAVLSSNEIWFSTVSGALGCQLSNRMVTNNFFPPGAQVRVVSGNQSSGVWIGTLDDGLYHWQNGRFEHWDELDGLSDNDVESIYVGRREVWLGTRNGGLNCVQDGRIVRFLTPWGLTGNYAGVITGDESGRLWIGTTGDGLFCMSNGIFSTVIGGSGMPTNNIHALLLDREHVLWAGTDGGLARLAGQQLAIFSKPDGLPDDGICQLQEDNFGNLWVGCNSGIYRLRKSQLRDYAEGRGQFIDAVPYGEEDGLPSWQCVPGPQITKADGDAGDGKIRFATSRGLICFDPADIRWNLMPPTAVLEQVFMDDVPLPPADPVRVRAGIDRIQFQYAGLSLAVPEKVRFRCQLEGFDRNWINMSDKRTANYTQVPPGRYRFRVIACNNDGVWSPIGDSVAVVVAPFWWQTRWFKLLAPGMLAALVFGLLRQRQTRLRELERLRMRIAGDLHDEVGSSLWSVTLLSQMLRKHGKMGDEERRDAGEIHRIAQQTSNAIRDIVWIINPAFDTVQDLMQRMTDFADTMLRGTEFQLRGEGLKLSRRLTLGFRENVFLMYKEILTNVAKHARASAVGITLVELPDQWHLIVSDNGAGFDVSASAAGNGLPNLRRRAEKIHATVALESQPGKGTTVTLAIPKLAEGPWWRRKWRQIFYERDDANNPDNGLGH